MRFIVVPIFIFLIMSQVFSKWILVAEYNINRSYIAKTLCENRNRPQLHCNGKCRLMKKMVEDEGQSSNSGPVKLNWETALFIDDHPEYSNKSLSGASERIIPPKLFYVSSSFSTGVFRPPCLDRFLPLYSF